MRTNRARQPTAAGWVAALTVLAWAGGAAARGHRPAAAGAHVSAYSGVVYQALTAPGARPRIAFTLSASGRTITGLHTTRPPGPTMYSDACGAHLTYNPHCQYTGYSVNTSRSGFPPPVIRVKPDGTFSGRTSRDFMTTVISGRFDKRRTVARGTVLLDPLSTPSNPLSPASATFTARRTGAR